MAAKKDKKPFALLMTLDSIKKGVYPSAATLDALSDEVDKEHLLELAQALVLELEKTPVEQSIEAGQSYSPPQEKAPSPHIQQAPVTASPKQGHTPGSLRNVGIVGNATVGTT